MIRMCMKLRLISGPLAYKMDMLLGDQATEFMRLLETLSTLPLKEFL